MLFRSYEVVAFIAQRGFDPAYGARPLKRAIVDLIEQPLAKAILAAEFVSGDCIELTLDEECVTLGKRR